MVNVEVPVSYQLLSGSGIGSAMMNDFTPRAQQVLALALVVLQLCSRTVEPKVVVDDRKLSLSQRTDRE
jgi:hypothetical protein